MTKKLIEPPQTLVLQKRSVQSFPNNQKVVLYYCRDLNKYFSMTYDKNGFSLSENDSSFIDELNNINEITTIVFNDGSELNINKECVEQIKTLYENLQDGHEDFHEYITESRNHFLKLLEYSIKYKESLCQLQD